MNSNDFTRPLADLIASLEGRVRLGVEQPRDVVAIYKHTLSSYELPADTVDISRVAGWRDQRFGPFVPAVDYHFSGGRLQWLGVPADDGSRLEIETVWREPPSGLTDFNPGSVAGTLLRAVARELALMYAQMDQAYRRAFIDEAGGVALDNVVALLGVRRVPAQAASGFVTFARRKPVTEAVVIAVGTRVADRAGRSFVTVAEAQIRTAAEEILSAVGTRLTTTDHVGEVIGVWRAEDDAATTPPLALQPPGATPRSIDLVSAPPPGVALRARYRPLSVRVPVRAQQAGPDGNVNARSLTLMPTPPRDVDSVVNEDATQGGLDAEPDERLRERARHELERAGNATLNAIRFAVMKVDGVQGVEVLDHEHDDSIALGELQVRYAGPESGKLEEEVIQAVNRTRAAGVRALVQRITTVTVSGTFYLVPGEKPDAAAGVAFVQAARTLISGLLIGQPLSLRRLQALGFGIAGLADLAESQLLAHQPQPSSPGVVATGEALLAARHEMIRPHPTDLRAVMLTGLVVSGGRRLSPGRYAIDLQLRDADRQVPSWQALALDVSVSARAPLQNNPTGVPVRVGAFTRRVVFTAATTAALDFVVASDLPGFVKEEHVHQVEFLITAAAYPGLDSVIHSHDITV